MDNITKLQILDAIRNNVDVFIKVSSIQYRIRCPICGDSQTDLRDAHCYIKCSNDPSEPLLYICFKCNSSGKITKSFLQKLHLKPDIVNLLQHLRYNKIGYIKTNNINIITGSPVIGSMQTQYIESRLGYGFTYEDYDKFKIIWDVKSVIPYIANPRIRNTLPSNNDSITFISDNKSVLLIRSIIDNGDRWRKIKLSQSDDRSFYTIKTTLDLFTSEQIYINIAEGIFDVLSAYKNFNDGPNAVFIALLGCDYVGGVDYAICKGFIGKNVTIKIYMDNNIDEKSLRERLKPYKYYFNKIILYKNIKYKDIGTTISNIKLIEYNV